MRRVERVERADLVVLQGLADGLEELFAMLLDQGLEKGHTQHLALALIDAGGQVVVNVVAKQVTFEEGAASMGLHEQLDGGFLQRLTRENLANDPFQLPT